MILIICDCIEALKNIAGGSMCNTETEMQVEAQSTLDMDIYSYT